MPFKIIRNNITQMKVDAIVNTANKAPTYSTGTDSAIYEAAGVDKLLTARRKIGYLEEGEVAITSGFDLPAKYIIHAVSPQYIDGNHGEEEKLRSCYEKSLQLARKKRCKSIAFPLIATGNFGYPKAEGMMIALNAIHNFLVHEDMMVYLVVFDNDSMKLSGQIFDKIELYIDERYVEKQELQEYGKRNSIEEISYAMPMPRPVSETRAVTVFEKNASYQTEACTEAYSKKEQLEKEYLKKEYPKKRSLDEIMNNVGETFQQRLFRFIDERGRNDVDVYKGACKDKKFFYKIRNNVNYHPTKHTVFAFAVSLKLNIDETKDLLVSAGYAFSPSSRFDLAMQYFFEHEIYDMYVIDCTLYDLGLEEYFSCE